jgi:transposase
MQARLDLAPDSMRIRRQTVEHPYGTIKLWMGSAHFLMRALTHVSAEMSLHVLAYNLKRAIKTLGIKGLIEAIKAWPGFYGGQLNSIVTINLARRGGS